MRQVKICGLTEAASFDVVVEAGADYAGMVFYPNSPRYLRHDQAASLAQRPRGRTQLVGLFVNPEIEMVATTLQHVALDILQIYGSASLVATLQARFGLPVWRQLGAASTADFPPPDEQTDGFVVEAKPPPGATRPGGNGVLADWALLKGFPSTRPWLLAGGLNPENVAMALRQVEAPGADVSSGVETAPGQKNPDLIRRFVQAVRSVEPDT